MIQELAPCFLVAAPSMDCPYFHHSVVLLVDHRAEGSLGFVVNRAAPIDFSELLDDTGIAARGEPPEVPVLLGGPVASSSGWVLFEPKRGLTFPEDAARIGDRVGLTASVGMLAGIARGDSPGRTIVSLGYSGWSAGQLDSEIEGGSWIAVDYDAALLFDTPVEDRWSTALARLGIDPSRMTSPVVAEA